MKAVEAVWRLESARVVAALTRVVHDVGLAEELAQDALVTALERWPVDGVPDNPGAWLMTVAKRRALDHLRRARRQTTLDDETAAGGARQPAAPGDGDGEADEERDDRGDVLRLIFVTCHPVLPTAARVALTLKLVGGLTTAEIARAHLVTEQTVARRVSSAKRTLAAAGVPFTLPAGPELAGRLRSVLEVVYLIFNEGYSATAGDDLLRPALTQEALRLGRLLAILAPGEAEVHGLVALMEIQASRERARTAEDGTPIPLLEQNRGRWDRLLVQRGFAAMLRAREAGGPPGPYVLQAAIAVCHAQATTAADTDWARIATLYDTLEAVHPTPVVRLNRAVAVGAARGAAEGLAIADTLLDEPKLRDYHLLPGVRADLLIKLGRHAEARIELRRAASLTRNRAERAYLLRRADGLPAEDQRHREGTLRDCAREFLATRTGASTRRSYTQTLDRLCRTLGDDTLLTELTPDRIARACHTAWGGTAPATWNRHRATLRSFAAWAGAPALADRLERRAGTRTPVADFDLDSALGAGHAVRERALWLMLRESGAPVTTVLALDVQDLDLDDRHAPKAGVTWRSGTARLLPALIAGRPDGPLFLSDRRPGPARTPADAADLCPHTGRRRLSYERAEYLCKRATGTTLSRLGRPLRTRAR